MATGGTIQPKRDFLALLDNAREQIAAILPPGVNVNRIIQVARSVYLSEPGLQQCTPASIVQAVGQAASLGLEVGKPRNHAHLVPYKGQCTLILDYRGFVELARRAGLTGVIATRVVYEADSFSLHYNPEPVFSHSPCLSGDPGRLAHVYAYARLPDGSMDFEIMSRAQVDKVKKQSPIWSAHYEEQARKTVLRRLMKRLPQSEELARAIEHDNRTDGLSQTALEPPQRGRQAQADRLARMLESEPQEAHSGSDDHEAFEEQPE